MIAADYIDFDDVCFIDCETRALPDLEQPLHGNVKHTTTRRYALSSYPIIVTWGYGLEGDVETWSYDGGFWGAPPKREQLPGELLRWDGYFAAYNSAFDRAQLDPYFKVGVEGWIDMMVQAAYNNLPDGLDRASKACGHEGKDQAGKGLIQMFCLAEGKLPDEAPEEWQRFLSYADTDIVAMQHMAASTLPVPMDIWEEFWASERINDRGLPVDLDVARGGARLAEAYAAQTNDRVAEISEGALYSVRQYQAQRDWVWERVRGNPIVSTPMIKAHRLHPETGEDEYKLQMDRPVITQMIAALQQLDETDGLTDEEWSVLQFLEEREFGASNTPGKFEKIVLGAMPDDTLPNQYVFGGAAQSGRFSSRGMQAHNLTRSTL